MLEQYRPLIEIFLVAELTGFHSGVAPFQATLLPPEHDFLGLFGSTKGHELHTKASTPAGFVIAWTVGMFGNQHVFSGLIKFLEEWFRRSKKEQVRVQISHTFYAGITIKDELRDKGCERPTIFTTAACRFDGKQPIIFHLA